MIHPSDRRILIQFLEREADMYQWKPEGEAKRRGEFISRMFRQITEVFPGEAFNFLRVKSLSNMGLITSELALTHNPWTHDRGDVEVYLPSSPHGGCGFHCTSADVRAQHEEEVMEMNSVIGFLWREPFPWKDE